MPFYRKGNESVKPRRALIEEVPEPVKARVAPSLVKFFALAVLLLAVVVGDTQAGLADKASASVPASEVPVVAQTATSTTYSAPIDILPIPKVAESSAPVKPKVKQSEGFAAAMVAPEPVKKSVAPTKKPSQKASSAPKKASAPKKVSAPKKHVVKRVVASKGSSKGLRALAYAKRQIGEPYIHNGDGPYGFDCSGLTMKAWASVGVSLPHSAHLQINKGRRVSKSNLRKGDLVFFYSPIHHVGIYAGNGKVLHASRPGKPIGYLPMKYMPFAGASRPA